MGVISFFYGTRVSQSVGISILIFGLLSFYALGSSLLFLVKELRNENDELVKKITVNAMAMSFVLILLLHIVQMVIRYTIAVRTGNDYNFLIRPGLYISMLDVNSSHLESSGVDLGIFAICLLVSRLRYKTWGLNWKVAAAGPVLKKGKQGTNVKPTPKVGGLYQKIMSYFNRKE